MGNNIEEVQVSDFTKITLEALPHQKIESALSVIGGGGKNGMTYKQEMLKLAGWKGNKLTSFSKNSESAALAFNKIRVALAKTDNADDLRNLLVEHI